MGDLPESVIFDPDLTEIVLEKSFAPAPVNFSATGSASLFRGSRLPVVASEGAAVLGAPVGTARRRTKVEGLTLAALSVALCAPIDAGRAAALLAGMAAEICALMAKDLGTTRFAPFSLSFCGCWERRGASKTTNRWKH
jgi:hypothetical protein